MTVQASELGFAVYGLQDDAPTQERIWLVATRTDAEALVATPEGHFTGDDMYFEDLTDTSVKYVSTGGTIQAAIDAADPGDTIDVAAGHFEEQLHVTTENLTISGAGVDVTYVDAPDNMPLSYTTSAANKAIVFIDGVDVFAMNDLTVDGLGRGNTNNRFQGIGLWNSSGSVTDVDVNNITDTPFSGAQHGVGIYAINDTGGPYTVNLTRVDVEGYQKNAMALNGTGLTANVVDCTTIGAGPTDVTAQNGIQFWGGAGGAITDCHVTGNVYTGEGWAGSGILLIAAGTVTLDGTTVNDGSPAVYCQETNATADGLVINNSDVASGNGFYVRIQDPLAAKAGGEMVAEAEPSPFGDGVMKSADKGAVTVQLTHCDFTGQLTGYGVSASNYQAADFIDLSIDNCLVTNWGWGVVVFDSGGDVAVDASDNGFIGNDGFFYAFDTLASIQDASGNDWGTTDAAVLEASILGPIDYTPWLGGGAALMPGYTGDFTELWVDDAGAQIGDGRIQEGIDSVSGSTVHVEPGSYVEALLIENPITLLGATAGVNKNGYAVPADYAWDPAVESIITHPDPAGGYVTIVDIHDTGDVTFDGFVVGELNAVGNANSSLVRVYAHTHAISNVKVENCVIGPNTNTTAQDGAQGRMGLYLVNHPYDVNGIENSSFSHNKIFDAKGNGDNVFLWTSYYAYGATGPADMTGTVIDDNEIYGSHRSGIETAGGFANLTISNNTIYGNSQLPGDDPDFLKYGHGIQLIRGSSDKVSDPLTAYGPVDLLVIGNEIYGNSKCGVYMGPKNDGITFTDNVIHDNGWNGVMVDLVGNYWNPQFESPPESEQYACYDCSEDIAGSGNQIYDNGTTGNPIADYGVAVNGTPTNAFEFDARSNWWGAASGPYHDPLNTGGTGNPVTDYVLFEPWTGMGTVAALPDASGPINCDETVTLNFHYTPDPMTPELRGFTVTVDCSAELSFDDVDTDTDPNTFGDIINLEAFDSLGTAYFTVIDNGDGTYTIDSALLGGSTGLATEADLFSITFHPQGDGDGTVDIPAIILRDVDNQDIGTSVAGATITVDCTSPPGVTGLTSAPGHEKVSLDWTMADASDVDHYEIWRAVWNLGVGSETVSAYPEYDDVNPVEPSWPADHAAAVSSLEWVKLTTAPDPLPGTAESYVDDYAPRGIYYYEVYAVDAAGNVGPGAGPLNRSTNYWLGDVDIPYDGYITPGQDIDELGASYGFGDGDLTGHYNNECDVGPTDDYSGQGIPETDSTVGFEDLMIFALNYGNVAPRLPVDGGEVPVFVWQRIDVTTWALMLAEPCADLKGVRLNARLPEGVVCESIEGTLFDEQSGPAFVGSGPVGLDVGAALLGRGASIVGDGELVRVTFSSDVEVAPRVTARSGDNADLEVNLTTSTEVQAPRMFAARQNFPNPFNPSTTISFDLPESREVRLAVYALDGSLVRTLVGGELPAGTHDIVWDGRDDRRQGVATGTYFYRLVAGPNVEVRKMLLMK